MSIATAISGPITSASSAPADRTARTGSARTGTARTGSGRRWQTSPSGVKRLSGRGRTTNPFRAVPDDARTLAPEGVTASQHAARGIVLYVGLDEAAAGANGTNLTAVAAQLQRYAGELVANAQTQAVIALAPEGRGTDLDAVRAVVSGSPAATGGAAATHGPVRSRIPGRVTPPADRADFAARGGRGHVPQEGLLIDAPRREVRIDGTQVDLTYKEFELLFHLVNAESETVSRTSLIEAIWIDGDTAPTERTVDVHVRRLRSKLGDFASVVRTIRGGGYRYDTHPDVTVWHAVARGVH